MPIEQTIDADKASIRRMTQEDSDEASHYTLTAEDEAENKVRVRIPPSEFEPELDRYVEDRLRGAVEGLDDWFHNAFATELEAEAQAVADSVQSGLNRIKDALDLKRPQSRAEPDETSDEHVEPEDTEELVEAA